VEEITDALQQRMQEAHDITEVIVAFVLAHVALWWLAGLSSWQGVTNVLRVGLEEDMDSLDRDLEVIKACVACLNPFCFSVSVRWALTIHPLPSSASSSSSWLQQAFLNGDDEALHADNAPSVLPGLSHCAEPQKTRTLVPSAQTFFPAVGSAVSEKTSGEEEQALLSET
jgi:hypothetical protein